MSTPAIKNPATCCVSWFYDKTDKFADKKNYAKITAFIASFLVLTIAVVATLCSTGVLNETFALNFFGKVGQLGSGILLTVSLATTVLFGVLLGKAIKDHCIKGKETATTQTTQTTQTTKKESHGILNFWPFK